MIREHLIRTQTQTPHAFRWRGGSVSRLEGFSDAVFGFALTLLVVSLEVPRTFDQLQDTLRGFIAFAVCFFMLGWIWYRHFTYFRRYGLEDERTAVLNLLLLFVVLFYVYPLKFLYSVIPGLGHSGVPMVTLANGLKRVAIEPGQIPALFVVYGAGFSAVFLIFGLMYWRAYALRHELELNRLEVWDTVESIISSFAMVLIGLLSAAIASFGGPQSAWIAGATYTLIGVSEALIGFCMGSRRRRLEREFSTE